MVVRMRHNRSQTASRRSHHALKNKRVTVSKEGVAHPRHRALLDGSQYRGRSVMDVSAKRVARAKKAQKQRERKEGPAEKKTEEKADSAK